MKEEFNNLFDVLVEHQLATEDEIRLVCSMNGHNLKSLESILYVRCGYRSLEQYMECESEAFAI
tara:strand:+ start:312 stop:503 length:192 start_codon:yes stop_codon:yes gene_type:complete